MRCGGYEFVERLRAGWGTKVRRARRLEDGQRVVVEFLPAAVTTLQARARLRRECDHKDISLGRLFPEQTGQVNRPVDYRGVSSCLGVTFYHFEAAPIGRSGSRRPDGTSPRCCRPPFLGVDALALVHESFPRMLRMLGQRGHFLEGTFDPLGPQPAVTQLSGAEARNRFNYLARRLVKATRANHPLVVFHDGPPWIDEDSLSLLDALLSSDDLNHLLITGNVVDLMARRLRHLPAVTRRFPQRAACVGSRLRPVALEFLADEPPDSARVALCGAGDVGAQAFASSRHLVEPAEPNGRAGRRAKERGAFAAASGYVEIGVRGRAPEKVQLATGTGTSRVGCQR